MTENTNGEPLDSGDGGYPDCCPHCGDRRLISRRNLERVYPDAPPDLRKAKKVAKLSEAPWVCVGCYEPVERE